MLHLSFRDLKVGFAICNNLRGMYRCHACVRVPVITIKKNNMMKIYHIASKKNY